MGCPLFRNRQNLNIFFKSKTKNQWQRRGIWHSGSWARSADNDTVVSLPLWRAVQFSGEGFNALSPWPGMQEQIAQKCKHGISLQFFTHHIHMFQCVVVLWYDRLYMHIYIYTYVYIYPESPKTNICSLVVGNLCMMHLKDHSLLDLAHTRTMSTYVYINK